MLCKNFTFSYTGKNSVILNWVARLSNVHRNINHKVTSSIYEDDPEGRHASTEIYLFDLKPYFQWKQDWFSGYVSMARKLNKDFPGYSTRSIPESGVQTQQHWPQILLPWFSGISTSLKSSMTITHWFHFQSPLRTCE